MTRSITSSLDPLAMFERPAVLGQHGASARRRAFGERIWVRAAPAHAPPAVAGLLRDDTLVELAAWPEPAALRPGDRVVVQVPATPADRARFMAWLHAVAAASRAFAGLAVAPTAPTPGGTHRLWCIAAARLSLPATVRVEARHDLLGIRLAQLAVGFGADTLAGPIAPDRTLPLCGVTRPDEATRAGLATLVRQVGLEPHADAA
jgi:hypothetical protein